MVKTVESREAKHSLKSEAQIVLCAFDKDKLLAASLLAKAPGGGGGHYRLVERLEVSITVALHYHSLVETVRLTNMYVKKQAVIQCSESRLFLSEIKRFDLQQHHSPITAAWI